MAQIYKSVTELVGKTPLLELVLLEQKYDLQARLLAKLEAFNPASELEMRDPFPVS